MPGQDRITADEIKVVRWIETILTPLLIASVICLTTCAYNTQLAVGELQTEMAASKRLDEKTNRTHESVLTGQSAFEVRLGKIEVRQTVIMDDLSELKQTAKDNFEKVDGKLDKLIERELNGR
ncbi:MAG: hypothetical protein DRH08_12380 [Deltaproteobacteria bacterium]|nr:MAG: hypothetical protein DRH08_12380 [Deltaproteobacteria bacterium]